MLVFALALSLFSSQFSEDASAITPNDAYERLDRVASKKLGSDFGCLVLNINRNVELKVVSRDGLAKARTLVKRHRLSKVARVRVVSKRFAHRATLQIFVKTKASLDQMPADQQALYTVTLSDQARPNGCPPVNIQGPLTGSSPESIGWIHGLQSIFGSDRLTFTQADPPAAGL